MSYPGNRTTYRYIVTSVLLHPLKQRLIDGTSFRIWKPHSSRPVPFKRTDHFGSLYPNHDRLFGLVVRVSGYRYRGPGFDPRRYQIF